MESTREDVLFMVNCRVTESKLLRLERGTRVLGFQNGAKKILFSSHGALTTSASSGRICVFSGWKKTGRKSGTMPK